jgi:hypothetical protein
VKRRPSPIPSLLAARVRTTRRAPAAFLARPREILRLSHGSTEQSTPACGCTAPDLAALNYAVQRAARALGTADAALGDIQARLQLLDNLLSPLKHGARRSPQQAVALQVEVDSVVEAIDHLARETTFDGRPLLRGDWSCRLPDGPGGETRSIHLASMLPQRLGNSRLGFLSSLRDCGTGVSPVIHRRDGGATPAAVHAIGRIALRQAAEQRRQIEIFSETVVQPCATALAVLVENQSAAATALGDADFAAQSSRFTPGHALVFISAPSANHPITRASPILKLAKH